MKTYSITRRLMMSVLVVEFCSTLLLVVGAGVYEGVSRFKVFDVMLRGRADSMLGAVQDAEDPQDNVMLDGTQSMAPREDIYAVRDELGRMIGQSQNWPDALSAFSSAADLQEIAVNEKGYRVIRIAGLRMVDPGDKGGGIARHVVVLYGSQTRPVWRSVGHAVAFYAVLGLILLGLSGWMMSRLLHFGLEPLRELELQARGLSVDAWHFKPSAKVREVRELAPLAGALEIALKGLERSFEQQRQFVGDAAHELKTSVSVVKSSLQLMTMRERSVEEYRVGLRRAEQDCERMEELVASMLTLAGLEAAAADGQLILQVEVKDVVWEVVEHLRSKAAVAQVGLSVDAADEIWVLGEREKVRLLCSNLIHNAMQHTMAGGEVRVLLNELDDRCILRIEDNGEGIEPEILPYVYERFFRGDASRSRRTGGTGLGLAISKAIVQGMHGSLSIASEVGRGTRVLVSLPIQQEMSVEQKGLVVPSGLLKVRLR